MGEGGNGHLGEVHRVAQGQNGPQQGQQAPAVPAGGLQKQGGKQDDPHRAPAVKGVEQAHDRGLVLGGAGLYNGADEHLDEAAPNGVQTHRQHEPSVGVGEQAGEGAHADEPRRGEQVGRHHAGPVADLVHKAGGDQIHQQLQAEVPRHQQGDLLQADRKGLLEDHKQQGGQVVDNGLGDVAQIAGVLGVAVIGADRHGRHSLLKIENRLLL